MMRRCGDLSDELLRINDFEFSFADRLNRGKFLFQLCRPTQPRKILFQRGEIKMVNKMDRGNIHNSVDVEFGRIDS
jgi:hypothetical protein